MRQVDARDIGRRVVKCHGYVAWGDDPAVDQHYYETEDELEDEIYIGALKAGEGFLYGTYSLGSKQCYFWQKVWVEE